LKVSNDSLGPPNFVSFDFSTAFGAFSWSTKESDPVTIKNPFSRACSQLTRYRSSPFSDSSSSIFINSSFSVSSFATNYQGFLFSS
jgi:hypothetical protein